MLGNLKLTVRLKDLRKAIENEEAVQEAVSIARTGITDDMRRVIREKDERIEELTKELTNLRNPLTKEERDILAGLRMIEHQLINEQEVILRPNAENTRLFRIAADAMCKRGGV